MHTFVRRATALLLSALLAGCGTSMAPASTATAVPSTVPVTAIPPTASATLEASPVGARVLSSDTTATWNPTSAAPSALVLAAGTVYQYAGEQASGWCRLILLDGAQPWVPCVVITVVAAAAPPPPTAVSDVLLRAAPVAPAVPVEPATPPPTAPPLEPSPPPAPTAVCSSFVFAYSNGSTHLGCGATQENQRADAAQRATAGPIPGGQ